MQGNWQVWNFRIFFPWDSEQCFGIFIDIYLILVLEILKFLNSNNEHLRQHNLEVKKGI